MRNLSLALCVAAALAPALAQGQPYAVGLTELQIADPEGLRPLDVQLLYPAEQGGQPTLFGGNGALAQFEVRADAPMAAGRFPLVLISHGLYGMASNYGWLTTELAANGMIVASPVHPGTAWINKDSPEMPKLWQRPRDLSRVITYLSDDPTWQDAIDADHIAAIGHSLGGYTVMALAGARFDTARYQRYCDAHPDRADCRWYRRAEVGRQAQDQLEQSLADPRVDAVVSLDLGFTQAFSPESVAGIDIPVLVIGAGSHLPDLPVDAESRHLAKMLPEATTIYLESDEITHFMFFSECRPGAVGDADRDRRGRRDDLRGWRRTQPGGPACRAGREDRAVPPGRRFRDARSRLIVASAPPAASPLPGTGVRSWERGGRSGRRNVSSQSGCRTGMAATTGSTTMTPHRLAMAAILAGLATLALVARAGTLELPALPAAAQAYADRAAAMVYAPHVRQGSLLMLRGGVGDGWLTLHGEAGWCRPRPVDLLYGDFAGSDIGISAAGPILVLIMRPDLARQLRDGQDLASKGLVVRYAADLGSAAATDAPSGAADDADVILLGDLRDSGFVLDPDTPFTDLFGAASGSCGYPTWRSALRDDHG